MNQIIQQLQQQIKAKDEALEKCKQRFLLEAQDCCIGARDAANMAKICAEAINQPAECTPERNPEWRPTRMSEGERNIMDYYRRNGG